MIVYSAATIELFQRFWHDVQQFITTWNSAGSATNSHTKATAPSGRCCLPDPDRRAFFLDTGM
jgi:hypothetical protein